MGDTFYDLQIDIYRMSTEHKWSQETRVQTHIETKKECKWTIFIKHHSNLYTSGSDYICKVRPAPISGKINIHMPKMQHWEQVGVPYLAQRHFDV